MVHKSTIEIYKIILERQIQLMVDKQKQIGPEGENIQEEEDQVWASDFGQLCSGLFNFYQFAQFEVKENFINLMENHMLRFVDEMHICLNGFLLCMLPGIDDQNELMSKKVERILQKTE